MPRHCTEPPVLIFDTTLRDGEQSPGASLSSSEKLQVARQLRRLKVDVIEAGFPAASPDDLAAVQQIAAEIGIEGGPIIAGLARATEGDIATAWKGVSEAARPRIHTFLATSEIHMRHKLRLAPEEVLEKISQRVAFAAGLCADVEFSPEDATRSDPGFLKEALAAAIAAGATTLNIPDTVGYSMPAEYGALIAELISGTPGAQRVVWSVHCHDDLGLATANSLAGVAAGARQIEATINGIGERAGNCALEEVAMALATRSDLAPAGTAIDTRELCRSSRLVSQLTGIKVPRNKAIVGANAFAHEAGIHQDGMLKHASTYEIMSPEDVGQAGTDLVLGKHSGRHAFRLRLEELGFPLDGTDLDEAFKRFKDLADQRKTVTDADLVSLAHERIAAPPAAYELVHLHVACGAPRTATATVRLRTADGEENVGAAVGPGPVDAIYRAMSSLIPAHAELLDYKVHSTGRGADALGEVTVQLATDSAGEDRKVHRGYATDIDIVVASANALLAGFNRLVAAPAHAEAAAARTWRTQPPAELRA